MMMKKIFQCIVMGVTLLGVHSMYAMSLLQQGVSSAAASSSASNNENDKHAAREDAERIANGVRVPIILPPELSQNQQQLLPDRISELHSLVDPISSERVEVLNFGDTTVESLDTFQEALNQAIEEKKPFIIDRVIARTIVGGQVRYCLIEELHNLVFGSPERKRDLSLPNFIEDPQNQRVIAPNMGYNERGLNERVLPRPPRDMGLKERRLDGFHIKVNLENHLTNLTDSLNRDAELDTRSIAYFVLDNTGQMPCFRFIGTLTDLLNRESPDGQKLKRFLQWQAGGPEPAPADTFTFGSFLKRPNELIASEPRPIDQHMVVNLAMFNRVGKVKVPEALSQLPAQMRQLLQAQVDSSGRVAAGLQGSIDANRRGQENLALQVHELGDRINPLALSVNEQQNRILTHQAQQVQLALQVQELSLQANPEIHPLVRNVNEQRDHIAALENNLNALENRIGGRIDSAVDSVDRGVMEVRGRVYGLEYRNQANPPTRIDNIEDRLDYLQRYFETEINQLRQPWYQRLIQSRLCQSVIQAVHSPVLLSRAILTATTAATIGTLLKLKAFNSRAMLAVAGLGAAQLLLSHDFGINRFARAGLLSTGFLGLIHSPAFFLSSKLGFSGLRRVGAYALLAGSSLASIV